MQHRIKLLPPELRDQIAAGEVVERPASVLKELLENSLDAGATEIIIKTEDGGQSYLSVRDNGYGMDPEDLALAVSSHATSKIGSFNDLLHVSSYGFRGEALPSIASVAKVRISSLAQAADGGDNSGEAAFIEVNYGRTVERGQAVLPYGSLVEVRDLFSNVPARLKFLKNNATELKRCQDVVTRAALAREDVAFVLYSGTRELCRFMPGESLRSRLAKIWPPQVASALGEVDLSRPGIRVRGLAGHPGAAQLKGDRMLFYVNKRAINNRLLQQAVRQAYKGRLLAREYPQVVLFVDVNPEEVDVNVHPAKSEVRFRDERNVFGVVLRAVEYALSALAGSAEFSAEADALAGGPAPEAHLYFGPDLEQTRAGGPKPGQTQPQEQLQEQGSFKETEDRSPGFWGDADKKFIAGARLNESVAPYFARPAEPAAGLPPEPIRVIQPGTGAAEQTFAENGPGLPGGFVYLGQLADTYLIAIKGDKLFLLDQHAAHERVLMRRFSDEASAGQTQLLALPLELQLHPAEAETLQQLWGDLQRLGFSLRSSGGATLLVQGIPPLLNRAEARDFLRDILAAQGNSLQDLLVMMSCKGAVKAGQKFSPDEALRLLQEWLAVPEREYCPHGRPAVLIFGVEELEKMFKRRS
ncbi:MAG: DNA mismatch repair endonuclease MutL [Deltaproteobacteria bacterium]|jgi:DNA mismatch repair protein MutL|nr:DNA mismatch repair endonuclease MutL [Deltaproteobacteria bacterium]